MQNISDKFDFELRYKFRDVFSNQLNEQISYRFWLRLNYPLWDWHGGQIYKQIWAGFGDQLSRQTNGQLVGQI